MAHTYCNNSSATFFTNIQKAMEKNQDITVVRYKMNTVMDNPSNKNSKFHFEAYYHYKTSNRGTIGKSFYNVITIYKAVEENC